jgi:ubiquinone/menaquinone biosynthesis C-methylase UbiE
MKLSTSTTHPELRNTKSNVSNLDKDLFKPLKDTVNNDFIIKNHDSYINFIKKYKNITECEKKKILNYLKLKNKFYTHKINLLFHTFYTYSIKNDINQLLRLQSLLLHFINYSKIKKILSILSISKNKLIYDTEIFNIIMNQDIIFKKYFDQFKVCNTWNYAIQTLFLEWIKIKNNNLLSSSVKYLDIGCGNAVKTLLFQNLFKLSKNNIYGTDIETWGPYKENKKKLPLKFKLIYNNKLDFKDNSFDFITCILTLHHVKELDKIILEIKRILKNDGIFLLIEHNAYTDYDKLIIDIEHLLYSALYDKKKNYIENPDYIQCYNKYEWNFILKKYGFICEKNDVLVFDNEHQSTYDNIYYNFYKIKK